MDKRADIWAFGVVLHELITGQRLFDQEDLTETLARVVMSVPKLDAVPVEVRHLLKKCLEKDPRKRLRDIGDAWELLDTPVASAGAPQAARSKLRPALATVLGILLLVALGALTRSTPPPDRPLMRLEVSLGSDVTLTPMAGLANAWGSGVIISPDGMRLVYMAAGTGSWKLFSQRLDQSKATEIPGTQGARSPFFSPDGQWIGFQSASQLNKVSVDGGAVVPLAASMSIVGGNWSQDGSIFISGVAPGISRVKDGGQPETVLVKARDAAPYFPRLLPGGEALLFSAYASLDAEASSVQVMMSLPKTRSGQNQSR